MGGPIRSRLTERLRRKRKRQAGKSWYVDETYIKVKGEFFYLSSEFLSSLETIPILSDMGWVRAPHTMPFSLHHWICRILIVLNFAIAPVVGGTVDAGYVTSGPEILVGVSDSRTGTSSSLGKELTAGSQAYFNLVNGSGGVHGRRIRMIIKDDHYEPEPAVTNTNDLITRDHVLFLFDYVGTPTLTRVLPLLRFYDAEQIVNVAPMTGAEPQRRAPYSRYVFNIRASYREEAEALVEYLFARGCRRFSFLGQADAYGKSGEVAVASALRCHGLTIVNSAWYRRGAMFRSDSAMRDQITALRAGRADAVITFGVYGPCARFIREARMAKWTVPIANVSFVDSDILLSELAKSSKAARIDFTANLVNSEVSPSPEESPSRLAVEFRRHVPVANRGYVAFEGWLNAAVAVEALRRCNGAPSRSEFVRAMDSLRNWDAGLGVRLSFDSDAHQALHTVWVAATRQGKWIAVAELRNGHYEEYPR